LALSIPLLRTLLSASLSSSRRPHVIEYCFWPITLVIISAVIVTGSRTGLGLSLLGIFAAMLIVTPRMPALRGVPGGRYAIVGLPLIMAAAIILVFISFGRAASVDRLLDTSGYQGELRFAYWPIILRETRHFLPTGSGLGTFDTVFRLYEPDWALKSSFFNHAHSDPLEWVLTTGVVGVLLLAGFGIWLMRAVRDVFVHDRGSDRRLFAQSAIVGVVILTLASLPDYPLRTPALSAVFVALLAFICVVRAPQSTYGPGGWSGLTDPPHPQSVG
jgi:O-antigen ligase